jgi:hypothetical protein
MKGIVRHAGAAWHAFLSWTGKDHPRFVLGYSLGTAVALHNRQTVPRFAIG